jgi:hypothetical protein
MAPGKPGCAAQHDGHTPKQGTQAQRAANRAERARQKSLREIDQTHAQARGLACPIGRRQAV